jgi:catechol 2,3-dioxygenase-like lactoylglutathione lyase family enzyme
VPHPGLWFSQIALCTADPARSARVLSEGLGFADAGVRFHWGKGLARIQALGEDAACTLAWLVGRQDFLQIELFQHTLPPQRPCRADSRPSDLGWSRFGIAVPDFDEALDRLAALAVEPLTEPATRDGLRRVCVVEPGSRVVVELMEDGRALPGGLRARFYDLEPAVVYATLSVQDLVEARRFFVDAIGLEEERDLVLHGPDDESLWGLAGARSETIVLRAADVFLELVRYEDPPGRPHPDGYLLSDQGFMNIALGFRDQQPLDEVYARLTTSGYLANRERPQSVGGTYVNDGQGNTTELLLCPREMDDAFGFEPRTPLYRPLSWQRARVPPAA